METLRFPILVIAGAAVLAAGSSSPAVSETPVAGPSVDQIVSARRAAMAMSLFVLGDLKKKAEQGAPMSEQAFMARSLANWAKAVPGMFPAGTSGSDRPFDVHAKPEIWREWPRFERLAADYIATTEKLRDAAIAGDAAAVKSQLDIVGRSCKGCHEAFRFDAHAGEKKQP